MAVPRQAFAIVALFATLTVALAVAASASAASASVTIRSFTFMPDAVTVNVGETVTWTNNDGGVSHTATSDSGAWDTDVFTNGSRTITFASAGVFGYHCRLHPFMQGRVTVVGSATPAPTAPPTAPPPAPTAPPATQRPSPPPPAAVPASPAPTPAEPSADPSPAPSAEPTPSATPLVVQAEPSPTATQAVAVSPASGSSRTGEGPSDLLLAGAGGAVAIAAWLAWRRFRAGTSRA